MQNSADDQSIIECSQAYKMEQQYMYSTSDDEHEYTESEAEDSESQV